MVHKGAPRGVWGNTISSWQFGIYREHPPSHLPRPRNKRNRRLRYCVVAAMATIAVLLISIMVYDVARSHGAPSRDKDVVQRLLLLQTATRSPAVPTATTSPPSTTTELESTTTISEVTEAPEFGDSRSNATNEPRARAFTFYDENTESASLEKLLALPYSRQSNARYRKKAESDPPVPSAQQKPPDRSRQHGTRAKLRREEQTYPKYWQPKEDSDRRVMTPPRPRPFHPGSRPHHIRLLNQQGILFNPSSPVSKPYAQLTNYRYPNDAKNIQDIIKYLTDDSKKPQTQNNRQNLIFGASGYPKKAVKFSGVYINPQMGEDDVSNEYRDSSEDKSVMGEMMVSNRHHNKYTEISPSSLNGHAYIADPFHNYKPKDPSEVNLLASSDFRFAPSDYVRFNGHKTDNRQSFNGNDKYFPRPPINFAKPKPTLQSIKEENNQMNRYPGTYTSAIYRPFGQDQNSNHGQGSKSGQGSKMQAKRKPRPFSVMLDIYPMTDMESNQQEINNRPTKSSSTTPLRQVWLRPRPLFGQNHAKGKDQDQPAKQQEDSSETRHQMIVHLNLYPRKKTNSRSDGDIPEFHVSIQSSTGALERIWRQHPMNVEDDKDEDNSNDQDINKEDVDVQEQEHSERLDNIEGRSLPSELLFDLTTPSVADGGLFNHRTNQGNLIIHPSAAYETTANGTAAGEPLNSDIFLHGSVKGSIPHYKINPKVAFVVNGLTSNEMPQHGLFDHGILQTSLANEFTNNGSGGWASLLNHDIGDPPVGDFTVNGSGNGAVNVEHARSVEDSQPEFVINVADTGATMVKNITETLHMTESPEMLPTTNR